MASDSEKDPWQNAREEISAKEREDYADDPAVWISKLISANRGEIHGQIKYYSDKQEEKAKDFAQAVADSYGRYLSGLEARLIFWLGMIAIVLSVLAGLFGVRDGLVIGAICIGLVVVGRVYWWQWLMWKSMNRLDRFRKRFRELLENVDDVRWQTGSEETRATDKAFLEKHKDSILFPSVIPYEMRERMWPDEELGHVETLYAEYCSRNLPGPGGPSELHKTADRVRGHIEGALSKLETAIESSRVALITQIGRSDVSAAISTGGLLEDFREWERSSFTSDSQVQRVEGPKPLLKSLSGKASWTFEEADKVREVCRTEKEEGRWDYEQGARSARIFDKLTGEMGSVAARSGLAEAWEWYDQARQKFLINEGAIRGIRRTIGRHEPEAMFRELEEDPGRLLLRAGRNVLLPGLENYGYDGKLVAMECKVAWKLISKQRNRYDRERDRELAAMQAFIRAERRARE